MSENKLTQYESYSIKLMALILNAQNLQLQAMRLTAEMQALVDEHVMASTSVIEEACTFVSEAPSTDEAHASCEADVHDSTSDET